MLFIVSLPDDPRPEPVPLPDVPKPRPAMIPLMTLLSFFNPEFCSELPPLAVDCGVTFGTGLTANIPRPPMIMPRPMPIRKQIFKKKKLPERQVFILPIVIDAFDVVSEAGGLAGGKANPLPVPRPTVRINGIEEASEGASEGVSSSFFFKSLMENPLPAIIYAGMS